MPPMVRGGLLVRRSTKTVPRYGPDGHEVRLKRYGSRESATVGWRHTESALRVRRLSAAIVVALLAVGLFAPASFAASATNTKAVPKVVFVVGPAGAATNGYRSQARAAAAIARKYTPDVIELYSPNATWPAVREALQGASLVVYMGHGNGWPSKYRDSLFPPTQDGFGLNPKTGGDDYTHQYFGEASVGGQVQLARNAIVLLNHLCYASGNSEPGLPEGNLIQAKQRVDNYAAGFIRAGAAAVIAEAWSSPSYFVKTILSGNRSIQNAWSNAPSANRNRLAFKSERSEGYVAQMDTETATSGFTRSVVMKTGLASQDVLAGAAGSPSDGNATTSAGGFESLVPLAPTLIGTKLVLNTPDIKRLPSAGTKGHIDVSFKIKDRKALPTELQASVRWDPIDVAVAPADPANEVGAAPDGAAAAPAATAGTETQTQSATPKPTAAPAAEASAKPTKTAKPAQAKTKTTQKPTVEGAGGPGSTPGPTVGGTNAAKPSATTETTDSPASAEASPGASPEASPSGSAAPEEGPAVALPADNPASDGGPAGSDVLAAPPVEEPDVTPRLEIPADELDLVVPERVGDVVAPAPVKIGKTVLSIPVSMPAVPGKYRLTITLHDKDGVVYDAATQALIPSLIVRVTGDFDGAILATPTADLTAGSKAELDVRAINLGVTAWGHGAIATATSLVGGGAPAQGADVVGRWVPLSAGAALPTDPDAQTVRTELPIGLQPGVKVNATLDLVAPTAPGQYLLLLDIVTPERGSLVAAGADPTLIRVTVLPAD